MSRFPIPKPRRSDGTMLPAVLVAALALMLMRQLALVGSDGPDIQGGSAGAVARGHPVPSIRTVVADQVIQDRPIFTPARANIGGGSDPLGGALVSGAWSVGRRSNLVL